MIEKKLTVMKNEITYNRRGNALYYAATVNKVKYYVDKNWRVFTEYDLLRERRW